MPRLGEFRVVKKSRTDHECAVCGKPIPKGSTCLCLTCGVPSSYEGGYPTKFFSEYYCLETCDPRKQR